MVRVKEDYFKGGDSFFKSPELSRAARRHGRQRRRAGDPDDERRRDRGRPRAAFVEARPDRFALGVGGFNLLRPMPTLRALESFVRDHPVAYAVVGPELLGRRHVPAERRGLLPALHEVLRARPAAVHEHRASPVRRSPPRRRTRSTSTASAIRFPELKLCMIHGADPWWDTAIRLMIKYRNLRLMTSAWSPKRLPESLLHYMRRAARTGSCSPPTTRCCRWNGASARPPRSTSLTRSARRGCTTTRTRSSSGRVERPTG